MYVKFSCKSFSSFETQIDYLAKKIKELREDKGDTTKTGMEQKSEKIEDKPQAKSEKDKDPKSSWVNIESI